MKAPQYHSAEVYNHIKHAKKRKRCSSEDSVPFELLIMAWIFAAMMCIFVYLVLTK
jgi:hypothetical protein